MRAVVLTGPGAVSIETIPDPSPGPGDLVVSVAGCGMCGTDIHLLDGELPYDSFPFVPGHEFVGEIVATGREVDPGLVGTPVAVDPNIPCRHCEECRRGRSNLCLQYAALGVTTDGGCAEYVRVPHQLAYALPGGMTAGGAQLVEPLSCAVHGFDLLPRRPGDRYLIYGAGTMGLLMGLLAQDLSSHPVHLVEPNPERAARAAALGFAVAEGPDQLDGGDQWETVIDCTGVVAAIEDGLSRVRRGGVFQCFGVASPGATARFSPFDVYRREITIIGSMAVLNSFDRAVSLAGHHAEQLATLVTHRYPLERYEDAVAIFRSGAGTKIVVGSVDPGRLA